MKVELLRYTPEGEKLIASAARLCYSPSGIGSIEKNLDEENTAKFLEMLVDLGHESPIEHISLPLELRVVS